MEGKSFTQGVRALPRGDRLLLAAMIVAALATLAIGVAFGTVTGLVRAGFVALDPETGYRMMTLHGVTVFFYWLYFAQMALLLVFAAVHTRAAPRLALAPAAWAGFALMLLGFAGNQVGAWWGTPLLYDASPELAAETPTAAGIFYLGYLALGAGLFLLSAAAIATALAGKTESPLPAWSAIGFGTVAWAGLVMVSAVATVNAFLPAARWAFGWGEIPVDHATGWHLLFHNLHYLPLMGTVLAWYVLVRDMTGIGSIFGQRFSKIVFTAYLVFVPPTSLYHMFLEPGLAPLVRALGSLLSLFIGVPTVAVFLVIVASLEAHARANGARGLFGWMRMLPWREPAMAAIGMAVVNLALGGVLAFVLIQEQLAQLLSDTFFVPGYFHFLTVGTVSLTLLAALGRMIPALTGRVPVAAGLLRTLPYVATAGIVVFGLAGMTAGLLGMPRRVVEVAYDGAAPTSWIWLSAAMGAGASVMGLALLAYAIALLAAFLAPQGLPERGTGGPVLAGAPGAMAIRQAAWTGPLSVAALVVAMYGMTALAFTLLRALPVAGMGGGGH
ncbi:MAG: cbb3-type cytochrome c oxidase subunit I [Alphaproteobacteria bacterium]|nr:cbb3-type cytochrome c oxidase subunit I [Alphaproteobacteria bacterium]